MNIHSTTGSTRFPRRAVAALALATAATITLAGCASTSGDGAATDVEQNLVFGLSGEPQDIRAGADQGGTGYIMDSLIHLGLLSYDADGQIVAALAETHEQIDNATYRFVLRDGLTFSDGTPLTSQNVSDTFMYYGDPANGARTVKGMSNIESIEIVDDAEFVVHLATNDPDFFEYAADPTAFIALPDALASDATTTIGAGPFVIEKESEGVSLSLAKNPEYFAADDVTLDGLELVYYADTNARTNALLSGDVDLIDYVAWEDFDRIEGTEGLVMDAQPGTLMNVEFNVTEGPFADPKVRQAVAYAINRDSVATAAFSGHASTLYGVPLGEGSPFASDLSDAMFEYDPEHAKELLAEAGYADGFTASLLTSSQYAFYQDTALTVQADLDAIGIDVTLDSVDWATRTQKSTDGDYDIKIGGGGGVVTSPAYLEAWIGGPAIARSFGYDNADLMAAFAAGRTGATEEERAAAYDEAFAIMKDDVPVVELVQREQGFAYKNTVTGFANLPGFLTFYSGDTFVSTKITG